MIRSFILFFLLLNSNFNILAQGNKDLCEEILPLNYSDDFSDLQFLKTELEGKKVVLLGEALHGVKQFANLKIKLVKFLHEELGYNVIAIEDEMRLAIINNSSSDSVLLYESLFHSAWKSNEMLALIAYLKTHPKLKLIGFDMPNYTNKSCKYMDDLVSEIDTSYLKIVKDVEMVGMEYISDCFKSDSRDDLSAKQNDAILAYKNLKTNLININTANAKSTSFKILLQLIENRIYYMRTTFPGHNFHSNYYEFRDSVMAQNLTWIKESLFPGEKVIVFSHNMHVAKARPKYIAYMDNHKTMGSMLPKRIKDVSYTIGLLVYEGKFRSYGDKKHYELGSRKKGSIEYKFSKCNYEIGFLALRNSQRKLNRLHGAYYYYKMPLIKMFDAILFVRSVEPQEF